ncbi:hypothetical protein Godav_023655, partial [Gossypium davidsonii]|nr:hypothetical protein [Gossypium davidsonii]
NDHGVLRRKRLEYIDCVAQFYDILDTKRSTDEINMLCQIVVDCPRIVPDAPFFQQAKMDEVLASVAKTIKNFVVIYLVNITEVPDINTMYELYYPSTVMFFFQKQAHYDALSTDNNNKINWALKDKQELIDIIETVYRGVRKGRGLIIAPKDYSTKYRY